MELIKCKNTVEVSSHKGGFGNSNIGNKAKIMFLRVNFNWNRTMTDHTVTEKNICAHS